MGKQIRRTLIGLAIILVCLTGLLAVSTLIPNVGCQRKGGLNPSQTHIRIHGPDQVATGQSFTVNGTLESGFYLDPFTQQRVIIESQSFRKEVITDDQGNFSCDVVLDRPGNYTVSASYPGDPAGYYWPSYDSKTLQVTGEVVKTPASPSSKLPYLLVAIIALVPVAGYLLYRRFILGVQTEEKPQSVPVWLSVILVLVAVGAIIFAFIPRESPGKSYLENTPYTSNTSTPESVPAGITLDMPDKVIAEKPLPFKGSLWQWGNNHETKFPLPNKTIIIRKMDYKTGFFYQWMETVTTDNEGNFAGKIILKKPGEYYIIAFFPFSTLDDPGFTGKTVIVENGPFSNWDSHGWLIIYGLLVVLLVLGYRFIYLRRRRKANSGLSLLFKGLPAALVVLELAALLSAFYPEAEYSLNNSNFDTRTLTEISLVVPEKVQPGQVFDFNGILEAEDVPKSPLSGQTIDFWLSKINDKSGAAQKLPALISDNTGRFSGQTVIDSPGQYEIEAVFSGTEDLYFQSSISKSLVVENTATMPVDHVDHRENPNWLYLIIGILLFIILTIIGYILWRSGFRRGKAKGKINIVAAISSLPQPAPTPIHAAVPPVSIELPQIATPLPDVWGKDDSLLIVFTVDGTKQMLAQYSLDIEYGTDSTVRSPINQEGRASQEHTYRKTGQYQIQAVLIKDVRNGYIPASRMVRIVDYREEIVRLYNEMVVSMQTKSVILTPKMTAREVENRLWKAFPELPSEVTDSLVSVFEEANYSLHPISRLSYEKMYLAVLEVQQYARK